MAKINVSAEQHRWCVCYGPNRPALVFNARGVTIQEDDSPEYFVYLSKNGALVVLNANQYFVTQDEARAALIQVLRSHALELQNAALERLNAAEDLKTRPFVPADDPTPDAPTTGGSKTTLN